MGINVNMRFYSPLRYPGGKGKLASFIKLILKENLLIEGQYVEPFAGGASIALDLLINEYVSDIHINDIDFNIYSFWYSVLNFTEELCKKIVDTEISVDEWQKQKNIYLNKDEYSILEVGFSAFYLNRTNRSGILNAGIIGGLKQKGKWKLDARFNKRELINRIQSIATYKNRINLYNEDALILIKKLYKKLPRKTLFYLDPPYFEKGKDLYINFYNYDDHKNISILLKSLKNQYWIISYDNVSPIRYLYNNFRQKVYSLNYFAGGASKGSEVIIFNHNILIPDISNPTNSTEIKKYLSVAT